MILVEVKKHKKMIINSRKSVSVCNFTVVNGLHKMCLYN